jgi:hypothetical protein
VVVVAMIAAQPSPPSFTLVSAIKPKYESKVCEDVRLALSQSSTVCSEVVLVFFGMVNVMDKVCEQDGCTTRPSFNFSGATSGVRCGRHREAGMYLHRCQMRDNRIAHAL